MSCSRQNGSGFAARQFQVLHVRRWGLQAVPHTGQTHHPEWAGLAPRAIADPVAPMVG